MKKFLLGFLFLPLAAVALNVTLMWDPSPSAVDGYQVAWNGVVTNTTATNLTFTLSPGTNTFSVVAVRSGVQSTPVSLDYIVEPVTVTGADIAGSLDMATWTTVKTNALSQTNPVGPAYFLKLVPWKKQFETGRTAP